MKHTTKAQGELIVDDSFAMQKQSDNLLAPQDLVNVIGDFSAGEVVLLRKENGDKLAKVTSNYSSCLLNFVAEQDNDDLSEKLYDSAAPILSDQYVSLSN
jgi:glutamate 5-kinase